MIVEYCNVNVALQNTVCEVAPLFLRFWLVLRRGSQGGEYGERGVMLDAHTHWTSLPAAPSAGTPEEQG